jgi:beta-RFAP synthase
VGRARRSAIGTWVFAHGGFVLEGGRREGSDRPAPLLARLPFPSAWRCVVAIPRGEPGVSGEAEAAAFARLPPPPERDVERVAHLVLMALLPALAEGDLETFGRALTEIQCINGRWFAPAQGGAFAPGAGARLVQRMGEWGAAGVGQSSWGPAVYGIVAGDEAAAALLVGLGVRELSMAPARIPEVKQVVRALELDAAEAVAHGALDRDSASEARAEAAPLVAS